MEKQIESQLTKPFPGKFRERVFVYEFKHDFGSEYEVGALLGNRTHMPPALLRRQLNS
jgi:hypothetical protein